MRDELAQLERTYNDILAQQQSDTHGVIVHPTTVAALRHQYIALSADARALRKQQTQLRAMLHERQLFHDAIESLRLDAPALSWSASTAAAHAVFTPLTLDECVTIMRASLDVIARFEVGRDVVSSGATYFGWSDKRRVDAETSSMHFTFTKRFGHQTAEELMLASWTTFCDEAKMRTNVFSSAVHVRLEVLQVVSDDIVVVRRQTHYSAMNRAFHTVYLLFRIETATGYKMCFRTISAPTIERTLEAHEAWINIFHWCVRASA